MLQFVQHNTTGLLVKIDGESDTKTLVKIFPNASMDVICYFGPTGMLDSLSLIGFQQQTFRDRVVEMCCWILRSESRFQEAVDWSDFPNLQCCTIPYEWGLKYFLVPPVSRLNLVSLELGAITNYDFSLSRETVKDLSVKVIADAQSIARLWVVTQFVHLKLLHVVLSHHHVQRMSQIKGVELPSGKWNVNWKQVVDVDVHVRFDHATLPKREDRDEILLEFRDVVERVLRKLGVVNFQFM